MENVTCTEDDKTITLVIDKGATIAKAGEPNAKGDIRVRDLVASSHGFYNMSAFGISLNVTRRPSPEVAKKVAKLRADQKTALSETTGG